MNSPQIAAQEANFEPTGTSPPATGTTQHSMEAPEPEQESRSKGKGRATDIEDPKQVSELPHILPKVEQSQRRERRRTTVRHERVRTEKDDSSSLESESGE